MKSSLLILILSLSSSLCFSQHKLESVSLMQLIVTPEKYHGKLVRVIGVARLEFEGNGVWFSKEDYKHRIYKNSLWLSLDFQIIGATAQDLKKFNGQYVLMEGIFNKNDQGHMGLNSGALERVTRFQLWERPAQVAPLELNPLMKMPAE